MDYFGIDRVFLDALSQPNAAMLATNLGSLEEVNAQVVLEYLDTLW